MDPLTLGIISVGSSLIGGVTSFIGSQQQAQAASSAANYQAQVAKNNQKIAEDNANYSRQAGAAEAEAQSMKQRATVGAIVAGQAASGIDPTTGSPSDVSRSARELGRLDLANTMQNAELRARGYDVTASNEGASAGLFKMQAANAQTAGGIAGFSSLLGGASNFSDKWLKLQNQGVF